MAEWLESLTYNHLPLTDVGSNLTRGLNLSCEEAIQLACGRSVVLPRCPPVPEIMYGGTSGVFLHQSKLEKSPYD